MKRPLIPLVALLLILAAAGLQAQEEVVEDVEAFGPTYFMKRTKGGENAKFPKDARFAEILRSIGNVQEYNRRWSGLDSLTPRPARVVERVPTSKNVVYLTFDDGPYVDGDGAQDTTDALLAIMKSKGATGTFFIQGAWAWKNRDLCRRIVASGSNLGNHTYHHPPDGHFMPPVQAPSQRLAELEPPWQTKQILWGRAGMVYALGSARGVTPYFRAPHGSGVVDYPNRPSSADVKKRIGGNGYITINGELLLSDARAALTARGLITTYRAYFDAAPNGGRRGEILWLHSGIKATVQALPTLIDILRNRGYQVAALPTGLEARPAAEFAPPAQAPVPSPQEPDPSPAPEELIEPPQPGPGGMLRLLPLQASDPPGESVHSCGH